MRDSSSRATAGPRRSISSRRRAPYTLAVSSTPRWSRTQMRPVSGVKRTCSARSRMSGRLGAGAAGCMVYLKVMKVGRSIANHDASVTFECVARPGYR